MWLVNFANDNYVEFNAIDIEDLMLLIVEYTSNDRKYFEKAMSGFKNDPDRENQYIALFNNLYNRYGADEISCIYEIKSKYEGRYRVTDNELIFALENKVNGSDYHNFEDYELLDLIYRLNAKIEKLEKARQKQGKFLAEERMQKYELINKLSTAKDEAYKNFATQLKCGVPYDTGVIRCKDVDEILKKMIDKL